MDKPLPLKIQEFQKSVISTIDQSEIPIYILKYLIRDLLTEIEKLESDFAKNEINEYYQSQQNEEEPSKEESSQD